MIGVPILPPSHLSQVSSPHTTADWIMIVLTLLYGVVLFFGALYALWINREKPKKD